MKNKMPSPSPLPPIHPEIPNTKLYGIFTRIDWEENIIWMNLEKGINISENLIKLKEHYIALQTKREIAVVERLKEIERIQMTLFSESEFVKTAIKELGKKLNELIAELESERKEE